MNRRNKLGTALVVLAAILFVVPAFFPVQSVLVHQTWGSVTESPSELRADGHEIVAYENLSERGQDLYVKTLENDGEYHVSQGDGAPEFDYRTDAGRGGIVIERPENDSSLPPVEDGTLRLPEDEELSEEERQRYERAKRYDAIRTSTEQPPLGAPPQLARLAAALVAVLSLGVGGYLLSSK